ncbi:MAG: hypothetical protein M3020_26270 [Myxococcota bacterium]|nr:hypothetical protein [Myxococcota bacterium]
MPTSESTIGAARLDVHSPGFGSFVGLTNRNEQPVVEIDSARARLKETFARLVDAVWRRWLDARRSIRNKTRRED